MMLYLEAGGLTLQMQQAVAIYSQEQEVLRGVVTKMVMGLIQKKIFPEPVDEQEGDDDVKRGILNREEKRWF